MNRPVRRRFFLLVLSSLVSLQLHAPGHANSSDSRRPPDASLAIVLKQAMSATNTPALAALVIRDGKIAGLAARGVRRNDQRTRVGIGDAWLIGSTSKPMTIALIAKLVDRGVLEWETPLSAMLPDLAESMRAEYRTVTLAQLLSHRSGLPENINDLTFLDTFFSDLRPLPVQRLAFITAALKDAPLTTPGSTYGYCNTGFLIAAVIAERAAGAPFEALIQREVFRPLLMTSVGFGPTRHGQLLGHRGGKPVTQPLQKSDDGVPMMYASAGNMHMSLRDWARFCIDQLAGSVGRGKLLSPASYRLMQTALPDSPVAMDWGVQESIAGRQVPVLVHGGSDGNWLAWAMLFPTTGRGVLVVANAADDMGGDKALNAVLAAMLPSLAPAK